MRSHYFVLIVELDGGAVPAYEQGDYMDLATARLHASRLVSGTRRSEFGGTVRCVRIRETRRTDTIAEVLA